PPGFRSTRRAASRPVAHRRGRCMLRQHDSPNGESRMRIDVHAHYFPPDYMSYLARHGRSGTGAAQGAQITLDERIDLLDRVGIDMQVLSISSSTPYTLPEAEVVEASRLANDLYVELCQQYPGRYAAFATLPLPYVDAAVAELERRQGEPEVLGVSLGCSI